MSWMERELAAELRLLPKLDAKRKKWSQRALEHFADVCSSADSRADWCDTCWDLDLKTEAACLVLRDLERSITKHEKILSDLRADQEAHRRSRLARQQDYV